MFEACEQVQQTTRLCIFRLKSRVQIIKEAPEQGLQLSTFPDVSAEAIRWLLHGRPETTHTLWFPPVGLRTARTCRRRRVQACPQACIHMFTAGDGAGDLSPTRMMVGAHLFSAANFLPHL